MIRQVQCYTDDDCQVEFTDSRQNDHTRRCQASHITIITIQMIGSVEDWPKDKEIKQRIANDINEEQFERDNNPNYSKR